MTSQTIVDSFSRLKGTEDTFLKANLAVYDNETLIVTGTSYYLWILDNFKVSIRER